jgi:dienelactone hydrolase
MVCAGVGWGLLSALGFGQDKPKEDPLDAKAREFLQQLSKGEYEKATKNFDATMKKVMPTERLKQTWESITKSAGDLKKQKGIRSEKIQKYDIRYITCEFANTELDAKIVFDSDKHIAGLFFTQPKNDSPPPGYVKRDAFTEKEVMVGSGKWAARGTLSLPVGTGPFPAVVLVHGSGPHDRDETLGPNKPFRDLAWGLASRGVAVLRYEKRTKEHAHELIDLKDKLTLKEEVIDDALAGATLLRKTERIDPHRIVILGHSLGAVCAPRMGELDPEISGLILMAGNVRPLETVIVEQLDYILSFKSELDEETKKKLEKIRQQAEAMKTLKLTPETPSSELPFGLPAAYWISLHDYHQAEVAGRLKQRLLILQGERDYQVSMDDFHAWQKALAGHQTATFKSYPRLNHLFMEGQGKATPAEYNQPGHVAQQVIEYISRWVKLESGI